MAERSACSRRVHVRSGRSSPSADVPLDSPPMDVPTPDAVRAALAPFDEPRQKIVAGLVAVMMRNAPQVRDREWIARQLTEVTLLAGEFEADTPQDGVGAVREFLRANGDDLLNASYLLFRRVGADLAPRAAEGFDLEDAMRQALGYFPDARDLA